MSSDVLLLPGYPEPDVDPHLEGFSFVEDEGDHFIDWDLIELYEILEFEGKIRAPLQAVPEAPGSLCGRLQWGARAPRSRRSLPGPRRGSTGHWEGPHMGYFPHSSCPAKVRAIQAFHMDTRKWEDIAYTSLVCPHGVIFQGRWWGIRTAANGTNVGNDTHYAHCYLGGERDPFTNEAEIGFVKVFHLARLEGGAGLETKRHGDHKPTACPGPEFGRRILAGNYKATAIPITPTPPAWQPEGLLAMVAKNLDDAARTQVREWCDELEMQAPSAERLDFLAAVLKEHGAEPTRNAIRDSPRGQQVMAAKQRLLGV